MAAARLLSSTSVPGPDYGSSADNVGAIIREHGELADTLQQQQAALHAQQQCTAAAWTRNKQEIETQFSELHELLVRREVDVLLNIDETYEDEDKSLAESVINTDKDIAAVHSQLESLAEVKSWDIHTDNYTMAMDAFRETFAKLQSNTSGREEVVRREQIPDFVLNPNVKSVLEDALFISTESNSADTNTEATDGIVSGTGEVETGNDVIAELNLDEALNALGGTVLEQADDTGGVLACAYDEPETGLPSRSTSPPPMLDPADDPPPYWQAIGLSGPMPTPDTLHVHLPGSADVDPVPSAIRLHPSELVPWHSFPLSRQGDTRNPQAVAMVWQYARLCVADRGNNKLKFFTGSGEKITDMTLPGDIYDVAFIDGDLNSCCYVLLLPRTNVLMFVSLLGGHTLKVKQKVSICQHYTAICKGTKIGYLVGANGAPTSSTKSHVDILTYSGIVSRRFTRAPNGRPLGRPKSIEVFMDRIIVSDTELKIVAVYLDDGTAVGEYSGTAASPLSSPVDLTLDHEGNVMILDNDLRRIHVMNSHCENVQVIQIPRGRSSGGTRLIAFDKVSKRLAIARRSPRDVAIFDVMEQYESVDLPSYSEPPRPLLEGAESLPLVDGMLPSTIERIGVGRQRRQVFHL